MRLHNSTVNVGATLGSPTLSPYRFRVTHRVAPTDSPGVGAKGPEIVELQRQYLGQPRVDDEIS